ncbi:MAG TPA: DUF6398 domain-containing protein [Methanospirillum sp.]|nr:DUF6398 domain-containing protein [Methanospirillum sp.]
MFNQFPTAFETAPQPELDLVINTWYPGFCPSVFAGYMDDSEKEYAEEILTDLTEFMLYYQNLQPADWTADAIEHCLLIDYPRSLARDDDYVFAVPGVLNLFFEYLNEQELHPRAGDLVSLTEVIDDEFFAEMDEVDNYRVRKALLISAEEDGIDIEDTDAVLSYFKDVGLKEMEGFERDQIESIIFTQSSWVLPFTDSRYLSRINLEDESVAVEIISTFLIIMTNEARTSPKNWDAPTVQEALESYMLYPMEEGKRPLIPQVLHAFFKFLAEEGLQPHAHEISETILFVQDQSSSKSEFGISKDRLEAFILNELFIAGVDLTDENAISTYLERDKERLLLEYLKKTDPEKAIKVMMAIQEEIGDTTSSSRNPVNTSSIPKVCRECFTAITDLTDRFCEERLDDEYAEICRTVAAKLARKKGSPILRGKSEVWAAGIIYAVGQMNFLFDRSFEPYQSAEDICTYFGTKKSTCSQKAKLIRDTVGMNNYWEPEFSTSRTLESNPFNSIRMSSNGFFY